MIDRKAYSEVVGFIKKLPNNEYQKIPQDLINYYEWHMDYNYNFEYNPELTIDDQKICKEARAIIVWLFEEYFANKQQKNEIANILKENEAQEDAKKREKYNPNTIFKNKNIKNDSKNTEIVKYKEPFFVKIKRFFSSLTHKKD